MSKIVDATWIGEYSAAAYTQNMHGHADHSLPSITPPPDSHGMVMAKQRQVSQLHALESVPATLELDSRPGKKGAMV